jgi:hypothetical protein
MTVRGLLRSRMGSFENTIKVIHSEVIRSDVRSHATLYLKSSESGTESETRDLERGRRRRMRVQRVGPIRAPPG